MNETRYVMSEVIIENVEQVAVKKKWKVKILLFPLIFFAFAIWTGGDSDSPFEEAVFLSFLGFPFYWVWEKAKKSSNDNNESSWRPTTDDRSMFDHGNDYSTSLQNDRKHDLSYYGLDSYVNNTSCSANVWSSLD